LSALEARRHSVSVVAAFAEVEKFLDTPVNLGSRLLGIGCPEAKLYVIPYGVDAQRFMPTRRLPHRILAVGRLVEKKAPHVTIKAFARVRQRVPNAELDMVGEGPLADECATLIRDLGLNDCVRMHGVQAHGFVADLMQRASLFVQHSVTASDGDVEGLPVAILEAMSAALRGHGCCDIAASRRPGASLRDGDGGAPACYQAFHTRADVR
jgi:colanic acid/amylovoran biosynthesis glycosyltransferase